MIAITTEKLPPYYQWSPHNPPPSGTVEFYMNTAENLVLLGHEVIVYYDGMSCEKNGVTYLPRDYYSPAEFNIHCNEKMELGKRNVYWTSIYDDKSKDFMDYDFRIAQSKYHQEIFGDSVIIGLGVYPELFDGSKKENICLYSSSPDRGGEYIDEDIIKEAGYSLIKTYKKDISEVEMIELYNKSRFWLHPCQGIELFCISAVKAQTAKCIPIVVPNMALRDTVKTGVKTTIEKFNDEVKKALKNPPKLESYTPETWQDVTKKIEVLLVK